MLGKIKKRLEKKFFKLFYRDKLLINNYRGLRLLLRATNSLDRALIQNKPYEEKQIKSVLQCISEHEVKIFIDIGANIGLYSLLLAKKAKLNRVVALEAQTENYNQLCGNIHLNKLDRLVEPIKIGASNKKGVVTFLRNKGTSTGTSRIKDTAPVMTKLRKFDEDTINVDKLDNILNGINGEKVFFKIDVEGHESNVLEGMKILLENNRCFLQIEILTETEPMAAYICEKFNLKQIGRIDGDCFFDNRKII